MILFAPLLAPVTPLHSTPLHSSLQKFPKSAFTAPGPGPGVLACRELGHQSGQHPRPRAPGAPGNRNGNQKVRRGPWVFSAQTSLSVSWSDAHLTCDVMGTRCHSCLCPQLSFVSPAAAPVSHPVQCPELSGSDDGVIQYKVFYSTLEKKHELF